MSELVTNLKPNSFLSDFLFGYDSFTCQFNEVTGRFLAFYQAIILLSNSTNTRLK